MNTPSRFLLRIPRAIYDEMVAQARTESPNECCGLLAGSIVDGVGEVVARYPLINELKSPTEFLSEPYSMFAATKDMRNRGIDVLAIYHSHPSSEPIPSKKDLERNFSDRIVNLIIGLTNEVADVRAWWLTDSSYQPAEFSIS